MAKAKTAKFEPEQQTIEELGDRYQKLNRLKIQAETNLKNARRQLEDLKKKAKKDYGTDDLEDLKKQLDKLTAENEQKRAAYQLALDKIEAALGDVEDKHGAIDDEGN